MNDTKIFILKLIFSIVFILIGFTSAYFSYDLSGKTSYGKIKTDFDYRINIGDRDTIAGAGAGGGVDSSNDGVAIGLGIIAGLSFLGSSLIIGSLNPVHKNEDSQQKDAV